MALNRPITLEQAQRFGAFAAVITPFRFDDARSIDWGKYEMLLQDLIAAGVNGIAAAVTTGEDCTLSFLEQVAVASHTHAVVEGRVPLIFGAGSNNTEEALALTDAIENAVGPSTFLHATGYKNNPPQEGIIEHFEQLATRHPQSTFIMYSVSSRTSSRIDPETQIYLMNTFPNIIGIKLAEPSMKDMVKTIAEKTKGNGVVISGEDDMVAYIMKYGGTGVISASATAAPKIFREMTDMALAGNHEEAERLQRYALPVVNAVFCKKNPIPLKYMFGSNVRRPLVTLDRIGGQVEIKSLGRHFPSAAQAVDEVVAQYGPSNLGMDLSKYRGK